MPFQKVYLARDCWKPVFDDNPAGCKVSGVIAIDMPGHGESTLLPTNEFANLTFRNAPYFDHAFLANFFIDI